MVRIGYMGGTDPLLLNKITLAGMETIPLGNGWDNHGLYIGHINAGDDFNAIVGYLHKFMPAKNSTLTPEDLLKPCKVLGIPVFLIAEDSFHEKARELLGDVGSNVKLVDPGKIVDEIMLLSK
ncbi:MAG: hypothetical protein ACUVWP_07090 [bacterium]